MITEKLLNLIKSFEGCKLTSYQDIKGIWTIGYGDTGAHIIEGLTWSQAEADASLTVRLREAGAYVSTYVEVDINQNQQDALTSFVYNLGPGALKSSHLLTELNMANFEKAADQFLLWDHAGNHTVPGLTRRRIAERALFLTPLESV